MKFRITGPYGELAEIRNNVPHTGIDLGMPEATTLRSITDGVVEAVRGGGNLGNGVLIRGEDQNTYIYGHMSKVNVEPGQHLHSGDVIGLSGNTGNSSAPHLHFGVQKPSGEFIDPTPLAPKLDSLTGTMETNWITGKWEAATHWFASESVSAFWAPFRTLMHDTLMLMWKWFITYAPDIMGYGAILTGACIILYAMAGKGIIKPIGIYGGAFILVACILMGA